MKSQNKLEYGVCKLSVASVYKNATPDFRLLTQVLFGELVRIVNIKNSKWVRIVCDWDETLGWMHPSHLHMIDAKTYRSIKNQKHLCLELIYGIISADQSIPISIGACLHNFDGINARMPFGKFQFSGQVYSLDSAQLNESLLLKISNRFLHAPEMKGGRSVLGIDASGFIQLLFKFVGIDLPRHPAEQSQMGEDVGFVEQARIGDLAFFTDNNGVIAHVGMVTGPQSVIHVLGRVKIDKLDQQGVFDLEARRYKFKLRTIRRLIDI